MTGEKAKSVTLALVVATRSFMAFTWWVIHALQHVVVVVVYVQYHSNTSFGCAC